MPTFGNRAKKFHSEVVATFPLAPLLGRRVLLSTDNIEYYYNGTEWVALGKTKKFTQLCGDATATTFVVAHNLNTKDLIVSCTEVATGEGLLIDYTVTNTNEVSVSFLEAPAQDQFSVTVFG